MQTLKKHWFAVSKITRIWWTLTSPLKILNISTFIGSFCTKYITFDLKKYRGVLFHDTAFKGDAKFKEKLTCDMKNDITNLANFHKSTWKSQSWDFNEILWLKVENAWAKNLQKSYELCDIKEWCKIWRVIDMPF